MNTENIYIMNKENIDRKIILGIPFYNLSTTPIFIIIGIVNRTYFGNLIHGFEFLSMMIS